MKKSPILVAVLAAGLVLAPTVAHAEDLPPWTATDESEPYLDCTQGVWLIDVTHYYADQLEPGVWADPTVTSDTGVFYGNATGDSLDSDCPNWVIDQDGSWRNTDVDALPPALPLDPLPPVETPDPEPVVESGKAGIFSPPKVGLSLTS